MFFDHQVDEKHGINNATGFLLPSRPCMFADAPSPEMFLPLSNRDDVSAVDAVNHMTLGAGQ